jgi:NAD(P)-dependent dehydrogenase (short-subunit alcohol dehydrogenase family)
VIVTDIARPGPRIAGLPTVAEDEAGLIEAVEEIRELGRRATWLSLDVTDATEVLDVVDSVASEFDGIDILFNNAGTPVGVKPFLDLSNDDWRTSWDVHVMGMVYTCRAAIPLMRQRGGGVIINNSSASGLQALPGYAAYTATKHAVIGLTKTIALEFGVDNIRAVSICPGDIDTDMTDIGMALAVEYFGADPDHQESLAPIDAIALRRRGEAEDVGKVVAWLASDAASYVNGNSMLIDGALMEGL